MKDILMATGVIALVISAFFLGKSCSVESVSEGYVDSLKATIVVEKAKAKELKKDIFILFEVIDSLRSIPPEIEKEIIYLQAQVDSSIAQDSSNAVVEYRKGLSLLSIRTESSLTLSLREIGLGGLVFRETYGLRLNVVNLNETIYQQDNLIEKQDSLIGLQTNIISLDSLAIEKQDFRIKELDSFWKNRFIFYIGLGAGYDTKTIRPAIQLGVGIRIAGND